MGFPQIGQVLKNGHTVDAAYCVGDARYVLAHRDGTPCQFAVWSVDRDGDTVNGRYFADAAAAQKKFVECCFDSAWWSDSMTERPQIVLDDQQAILESTMEQLRPVLEKALLKFGISGAVSVDDPDTEQGLFKNAGAPESKDELRRKIDERKSTVDAVIQLIIERMEEKDMGHLTTGFVIGVLRDAIEHLESASFMRPASDCFTKAVSPEDFLHYTTSVKDIAKAMERMGKYSRCGF